ncbi:MAG: CehA/McbA family metallohydrolase [Planctomycetes bacterium]|nr:CehA/McbA family metallohydrolase [Planctomycetota bacterium]
MKAGKTVFAMAGTGLLLSLAIAMHAAGQFGGTDNPELAFFRSAPTVPVGTQAVTASNYEVFATSGKEADAILGDSVLSNGYLTAVIAQPVATRHANMTVKDVAGALIDLSSVRRPAGAPRGFGGDQLAAFYPGRKQFPYRSLVSSADSSEPGQHAAYIVKADGADERPEVQVAYELNKQDPFLTVRSTFTNRTSKPLTVALEDDFRVDGGKEDMVRTPNGTVDRFWLYDRFWGQAYGLDAEGYTLQLTSDARVTTIKYVNAAGETSVKLPPGESFVLKRRLYPGATIFDVHSIAAKSPQVAFAAFSVPGARQEVANLAIELSQGDNVLGMARMVASNRMSTSLPPGEYTARLYFCGNPVGERQLVKVVTGHNDVALKLDVPLGRIVGTVVDSLGGRIPCKVELKPLAEGAKIDFGPETAEFAVRNLIYTPNGQFEQTVPAGRYAVIISHGPEFDIIQPEIEVKAGSDAILKGTLVRSVDTTGWISSDFHSHSSPSGDNTSSQLGRVLNLVCEHVEFAPCTEHNRVTSYEPHIKALGIEKFLSSVPGIEMTGSPLPLNHQNAFPMKYTPGVQDGGGPISGPDLETQIERLGLWDDRSEKLLQVNHPDMGWMFYDKDGDGKPDSGFERAFPFMDVVEIHPIENALNLKPTVSRGTSTFHNTVFNWLQLLNQGFRIYGVVNTDAHYNFHGSGFLRNWIQSSTDAPAEIKYMDMVHAAEQGRLVMSNGPYLEVTASETGKPETVVSGQDLKASSGKVTLKVRVQCPNWLDVNRLFVLVNGRHHSLHDYSREQNPDAFRSGVVKFERTLDLDLKGDAHLVVVTGLVGGSLGAVHGPTYGKSAPTAITNPIFVDVDGNGFTPNKDTLDAPLPVKHPNSK